MLRPILILAAAVAVVAAEPVALHDGETLALSATTPAAIRVVQGGATIVGSGQTLHATVTLEGSGTGGLTASYFPGSRRGVRQDDWTATGKPTLVRNEAQLHQPASAFGSEADRTTAKISGNGGADWEDFSVQWDGWLLVERAGTDLATISDDGSRVWLDLDSNGKVTPGEWGENGWGQGQAPTQRTVHPQVPAGTWRIRVQFEDGNGGNSVSLLWNIGRGATTWQPVSANAFVSPSRVTLAGLRQVGAISGEGTVRALDDVILAGPLNVGRLLIAGRVSLGSDLMGGPAYVSLSAGAAFDLAGQRCSVPRLDGDGQVLLRDGTLAVGPGDLAARVTGPGILALTASGALTVAAITADVAFDLALDSRITLPDRTVARVRLAAPLTTVVPLATGRSGPIAVVVEVEVPPGAPTDLGLGAYRTDGDGHWWQVLHDAPLHPGRQSVRLVLDHRAIAEGHGGRFTAATAVDAGRIGVFLWSAAGATADVRLDAKVTSCPREAEAATHLNDLVLPGLAQGIISAPTGKRWELAVRPTPWPVNPWDPAIFALDLHVTAPDGQVRLVPGFHQQPMRQRDRGDREELLPDGAPFFAVRLRPATPGRHQLQLIARWGDGRSATVALPPLEATGEPYDDWVRVDADRRYFSAGGKWVWPVGVNLHSTYDVRAVEVFGVTPTPPRGSLAIDGFLTRLGLNGATGVEVWCSAWNLALEWRKDWPGYRGAGRHSDANAWRLDRTFERAEALGMRINLELFNHGMANATMGAEAEWLNHPHARAAGGWIDDPQQFFTDPESLRLQEALFRHMVARLGDSPALLGWKLWSECNLTNHDRDDLIAWHRRMGGWFHANDPYRHPVTTHWNADWRTPDREMAALTELDYLTIDAYHEPGRPLADMISASTQDPVRKNRDGLALLKKPVWISEFGGNWNGCSPELLHAELASAPWAALMAGHAAAPLTWWFEWVDQEQAFASFNTIRAFIADEDLRGSDAKSVGLTIATSSRTCWARGYARPGRMLGYVLDRDWGLSGDDAPTIDNARITVGSEVRAGSVHVEWWNADTGTIIARTTHDHPGGRLDLEAPPFARHLAFKMTRK